MPNAGLRWLGSGGHSAETGSYEYGAYLSVALPLKPSDVLPINFTYDHAGNLASVTRYRDPEGTEVVAHSAYSYDAVGRTTDIQHVDGSSTNIAHYTYTYDDHGRLAAEGRNGVVKTYTYDDTDQVTGDGTGSYSFDSNGNRTMTGYVTGDGAGGDPDDNRLSSGGTWNYVYDAEGNRTEKDKIGTSEKWFYFYDNANHLTKVDRRRMARRSTCG